MIPKFSSSTRCKLTSVFAAIIFSSLCIISCKDNSPDEACGCEGKTTQSVKNLEAVYVGDGYFHIKGTEESRPEALLTFASCTKMSDSLKVSSEQMVPNYILSGDIKKSCFSGETLIAITPSIAITELRKK